MTGGRVNLQQGLSSIEIIDENGSHSSELRLPWKFERHCAIKLNQTHAMLTGGKDHPAPSRALIINLNNSETTSVPDLVRGRYSHACSRLSHPNGTNYIIVAG